jgi:hypothetical protein
LNLQGIEYIQKIKNLIRVPLGRNRARPTATWARPVLTARAWPPCMAHLASAGPRSARRTARARTAAQRTVAMLHGGSPPAHGRRPRKRGTAHRRGDGGTTTTGERLSSGTTTVRTMAASDRGDRDARGWDGGARDEGAHLSPRARVWTEPPTAANQGSARRDTATDRRAPRVSRFLNLNKSSRMKIARRK